MKLSTIFKEISRKLKGSLQIAKAVCSVWDYAEKCLAQMPLDFDKEEYFKDKKKYLEKII